MKFAQDLSEHWYKPFASREETVAALVNQGSGAFLIRNSNSFPGAFGLAVKVTETAGEKGIRHFLIEPTRFGVRLRGSPLEPVFSKTFYKHVCTHIYFLLLIPFGSFLSVKKNVGWVPVVVNSK